MTDNKVLKVLQEEKFICIFRGIPTEKAADVARALVEGGAKFIEITYNHKSSDPMGEFKKQFEEVKAAVGDQVYLGAGTVLTEEQVDFAKSLGAVYIVSPNTNEAVIRKTKSHGMVSVPGAMSPSEIVFARECGADIVKLYIVEDLQHVKYLQGPLGHIPMQLTCGVSVESIPKALDAGIKCFGTRAFITNDLIENSDYKEIARRMSEHLRAIKTHKK